MRTKETLKQWAIILAVLAVLGGAAVGAMLWNIHDGVKRYSEIAQEAHPHPGDDVAALIAYVKSEEHSLRERNLAVWTLGRLRDPAALAALESYVTGRDCEHATQLCQGELQKAIQLCGGG